MSRRKVTIDGNEAAASVAFRVSEVCAIYPITPSSNMGEWADEWAAKGKRNVWGGIPVVSELQSEGGASGAVHGALQTGALTSTFTASQGLLLMIPNMFKIAGELTSTCFHVSARSVATHALSIFGDHSDVMACRSTGFGFLASGSIQEVMDMAAIGHAATLEARLPFVHFFDGFRSSHEVQKIEELTDDDLRQMINYDRVVEHRERALNPDNPVLRGTAQNPDVFFQAREACNKYYAACPEIVQQTMDKFAKITGRQYHLFDYVGAPDAERVVVIMGSGSEAAHEAVEYLVDKGEKVGVVKVHLYRPFAGESFIAALPKTVKSIAVLDRTKEPGAEGEPLYKDVLTTLHEHIGNGSGLTTMPKVFGGRYGLSSKEFTPAMVKAVLDEAAKDSPKNHFTVGINDDKTNTSLDYDPNFSTEAPEVVRAVFFGLGSDGTVGANKNSIKIIGEETDNYAQGYFVYDSKKAGSVTVSHLRFGPKEIHSTYLISQASFVACHHEIFLERYDVLGKAAKGAIFLLNTTATAEEAWDRLPIEAQTALIEKGMKFYVIDAYKVSKELGLGARINTIMQTCFFAISGVLPPDEAIAQIKQAIQKTYGKKGEKIVKMNFAAVDQAVANLHEVKVPDKVTSTWKRPAAVSDKAPQFVRDVTATIISNEGDSLPVSAMPEDGTFPTNTARWEKRCIANEVPIWDEEVCIQCGKCVLGCPHAAIRMKAYPEDQGAGAPESFKMIEAKGKEFKGMKFTLQVAAEDCTGCAFCVDICPAKNKQNPEKKAINMSALTPDLRTKERDNYDFFLNIPEMDRSTLAVNTVKGSQFLQPLFEYSGACAGCGETPYVKLLSQLFGDRAVIGNATGCSSIYGGNLPTTPWAQNADGRGPAWSNSLFEDNAEFGFGFRLTLDKHNDLARELLQKMADSIGADLVKGILEADQSTEGGIAEQRKRVAELTKKLEGKTDIDSVNLRTIAHALVKRSVWVVGGDGWAYDIGYGGLDHVLASGANVNVLVLDTEVYSNTGGQCSKSTPRGAVAKFAAAGKPTGKKDLGMMAMSYGTVFVASVAFGSNDTQCVKAFVEAEAYNGPSLILAYSPCIAHGINMTNNTQNQKDAVNSGHWPLYRYNPDMLREGKNPLQIDSKAPSISYNDYAGKENRFSILARSNPERAAALMKEAQHDVQVRRAIYENMTKAEFSSNDG